MESEFVKLGRGFRTRWRRLAAGAAAAVAIGLGGCTGSDPNGATGSSTTESTPTFGVLCREEAQAYEELTRELSPETFLSRVAEADVERVEALLYPDDHPRAGEFIPVSEWDRDQKVAWDIYVTTRGNYPVGMEPCARGRGVP